MSNAIGDERKNLIWRSKKKNLNLASSDLNFQISPIFLLAKISPNKVF